MVGHLHQSVVSRHEWLPSLASCGNVLATHRFTALHPLVWIILVLKYSLDVPKFGAILPDLPELPGYPNQLLSLPNDHSKVLESPGGHSRSPVPVETQLLRNLRCSPIHLLSNLLVICSIPIWYKPGPKSELMVMCRYVAICSWGFRAVVSSNSNSTSCLAFVVVIHCLHGLIGCIQVCWSLVNFASL